MKHLHDYLINEWELDNNTKNDVDNPKDKLDYQDVLDELVCFFDSDEFPADPHYKELCSGKEALENNGLWDVMDFVCGWDVVADEIGCTEDELQEFVDKYYDKIESDISKSL